MKRLLTIFALAAVLSSCGKPEAQIITSADRIADGEWICFRRSFTLLSPSVTELRIAADTKYWLWVNGELVVREGGLKRGPNPTDSYCDVLTEVEGLRCVAILWHCWCSITANPLSRTVHRRPLVCGSTLKRRSTGW